MSSKSKFIEDLRVEALEVGNQWIADKACATTSGELALQPFTTANADVQLNSVSINSALIKVIDDTMFVNLKVKLGGAPTAVGTGNYIFDLAKVFGGYTFAVTGELPVGTFRLYDDNATSELVGVAQQVAASTTQVEFVGVLYTEVPATTTDTQASASTAGANLAHADCEFSASLQIPIKRVDHK